MSFLPRSPESSIRTRFEGISGFRAWLAASLTLIAFALMVVLVPAMLYLMIAVTMLSLMVGMAWVMIVLLPFRWLLG